MIESSIIDEAHIVFTTVNSSGHPSLENTVRIIISFVIGITPFYHLTLDSFDSLINALEYKSDGKKLNLFFSYFLRNCIKTNFDVKF